MKISLLVSIAICFLSVAHADWRSSPEAKKEYAVSETNSGNCKKEFANYLREEWAVQNEKIVEKYKKSGMKPKEALEKAEKETTSWTKENSRINSKAEDFCSGQNWAVGCKVSFKKNVKSGAECTLTPIDKNTRQEKGREKIYPKDFA